MFYAQSAHNEIIVVQLTPHAKSYYCFRISRQPPVWGYPRRGVSCTAIPMPFFYYIVSLIIKTP